MAKNKKTKKPVTYLKVEGIVIKYTNINDSDRIITILSPHNGKLSVLVKNCRQSKHKQLASVQLFAQSKFLLAKRGKFHYIKDAELNQSFFNIIQDVEKYTVASYLNELIYYGTTEDQSQEEVYAIYLKSLYYIMLSMVPIDEILIYFDLHLTRELGFGLQLNVCHACGNETEIDWYDPVNNTFLCSSCVQIKKQNQQLMTVNRGTIKTLMKLLECDDDILGILKMSKQMKKEINMILENHVNSCFDKKFKSREMIRQFLFLK